MDKLKEHKYLNNTNNQYKFHVNKYEKEEEKSR